MRVERRRRGVGAILHIYRQSKGLSKPPFYRRCKGPFSCSLKAVRKGPTVFKPQKIGKNLDNLFNAVPKVRFWVCVSKVLERRKA